jgi:hypothetical protein
MKSFRTLSVLLAVTVITVLLTGCDGSTTSGITSDSTSDSTSGTTDTGVWYLAVRAYNDANEYSPYSNEANGRLEPGTRVTLAWESPTRTLDGECTNVAGYVVGLGNRSAAYSHSVNVGAYSTGLSCRATGVDSQCGTNINTCEAEIVIPTS